MKKILKIASVLLLFLFFSFSFVRGVKANGQKSTQDFTWGVLTINTNKSFYLPNEKAEFSIAVLDEAGMMVCDAKLKLTIKENSQNINDELTTENGKIIVNPECQIHGFTEKPDYEALYQVKGPGRYEMILTAETRNGSYTITDFFEVKERVKFDVERDTATRIYPPKKYPVIFNIIANQDFVGTITETVPKSFDITPSHTERSYDNISSGSDLSKILTWNVSLKKGEKITLGYQFDAPDISPRFYLLGPLRLRSGQAPNNVVFEEARQWQIAADADIVYTTSGNFVAPANVYAVYVEAWGAGGGGGTINASGGGGGGGGAYAAGMVSVTPGNTYAYVVGVGGVTDSGLAGGDSSFNSTSIIAKGGAGTSGVLGALGGLATGSTGTVKFKGGDGKDGHTTGDNGGGGGGAGGKDGAGVNGTAAVSGATIGGNGGAGDAGSGGAGGLGVNASNGQAGGISQEGGGGGGGGANGMYGGVGGATGGGGGGAEIAGGGTGGNGQIRLTYNYAPTTQLNTPTDTQTISDTTPTLNFTGTDLNLDTIEYNVQVDTVNTFDSQSTGFDLKYVDLYVQKSGTPTDNVTLEIRATIDGAALGTSNVIAASSLGATGSWQRFTFTTPITLTVSTVYYMVLKRSGAYDVTNYISWWYSQDPYSGGMAYRNDSNTWTSVIARDYLFIIYDVDTIARVTQDGEQYSYGNVYGETGSTQELGQSFTALISSPLLSKFSTTDAGFTAGHPFASGVAKEYTVQSALTPGITYYWRVRAIDIDGSGTYGVWSSPTWSFTVAAGAGPTKVVFTNTARTLTAGVCNGDANVLTIQLQDAVSTPTNPTGTTVIRVSSGSPDYTIYSDNTCVTVVTNGDFTFTTAENTKNVYIKDFRKSGPTWTLTAAKQSGPDTIADGTQAITINAGSVTRLVITLPSQTFTDGVGNSGTVINQTAGSPFTITKISATDSYFNVNTSYTGAKTLAYAGPGNAPNSTPPAYTTSVSFTSGQSTTTLTTTLYKAETPTITATDGGLYGYASSSLTVDAGILNNYLVVAATPQTAGVCFTGTNTITARDQWLNTRTLDASVVNMTTTGTSVTFYTTSACSTSTTQYTMSSGQATMYIKTPKKQSGFTVTATRDGFTETGTSGAITVDPAAASAILVKLPGQTFTDGTGISGTPSFTGLRTPNATAGVSYTVDFKAVDANNNLVNSGPNNYTGNKTISFADSVAGNAPDTTPPSFPASPVTFANGEANTLTITYYNAATGRTVEADDTVTPVSGTASTTFIVQANSVNNYGVSASTPQTAGAAFNVTITSRDDWNNSLGSLYSAPAGTYIWTTTAANAPDTTAPTIGTLIQGNFVSGVATKSVTLYKAESGVTFTASEPSPSTVTGISSGVTVNPGSISADPNDSTVTGDASVNTNTNTTITITLKDTWRNPKSSVPAADVVLSATPTETITQPSSPTDASGVTTGQIKWSNIGDKTVTVTIQTSTLVQNDGTTPDADGKLDDTHTITVVFSAKVEIKGGTELRGGSLLGQ